MLAREIIWIIHLIEIFHEEHKIDFLSFKHSNEKLILTWIYIN